MTLADLTALMEGGDDSAALRLLEQLTPEPSQLTHCAQCALILGRPSLAVGWWTQARDLGTGEPAVPLGLAAAWCRLGDGRAAENALRGLPDDARAALLRARARQLQGDHTTAAALHALHVARRTGDAPALVAAVTMLGELQLARGEPREALRTLAEGLKVAELTGQSADPHLLAVLALTQAAIGSPGKARATAEKALARSAPRSPARVLALRALGRHDEAQAEAHAGELHALSGSARQSSARCTDT